MTIGPFKTVRVGPRVYVQCGACQGWGRENWAHGGCCRPGSRYGNWYASIGELEKNRGSLLSRKGMLQKIKDVLFGSSDPSPDMVLKYGAPYAQPRSGFIDPKLFEPRKRYPF